MAVFGNAGKDDVSFDEISKNESLGVWQAGWNSPPDCKRAMRSGPEKKIQKHIFKLHRTNNLFTFFFKNKIIL